MTSLDCPSYTVILFTASTYGLASVTLKVPPRLALFTPNTALVAPTASSIIFS